MPPSSQERVAKLLLRIETEKRAIAQTRADLQGFEKDLLSFKKESERSNRALEQQARALQLQQKAALTSGRETDKLTKEQRDLAQETNRTTDALKKQAAAATGARGRSFLTAAGQELRALPAVPLGPISSDVIGKLTASLGALPPAAAAGAVAAGALVAAIAKLKEEFEKSRQAALQAIEFQARLNLLREQGTKKDIQTQIDDAQSRFDTARSQVQVAEQTIDQFLNSFENAAHREINAEAIRKAIAGGFKAIVPPEVQAAIDTIQQQGQEAERALIQLTGLKNTLKDTEVQTRITAEALQALTDQRVKIQLQTELAAAKMSSGAIRDRINSINREITAILGVARAGEISSEAMEELTARQRDLITESLALAKALPDATARERLQAIADGIRNIPNAVKAAAGAIEELKKAGQAIGELQAEFKARVAEIQAREKESLDKAIADRDEAIREAEQRAADDRADLRQDEITAELRHLKDIVQIRRRANLDINNAIQNRDAVALDQARETKKQQLADAKENYAEEQRQLKLRYDQIDRDLKRTNATIARRYDEQVRTAHAAAVKSLTLEQQKFSKELQLKVAAYQALLTQEAKGVQAEIGLKAQFWQDSIVIAQRAVNALRSMGSSQAAQVVKPSGAPPRSAGGKIPSMDTGGRIMRDGLIYAHRGEIVVNPRRASSMGNITFAPQISGQTRGQVKRQVNVMLDEFLEDIFPNG